MISRQHCEKSAKVSKTKSEHESVENMATRLSHTKPQSHDGAALERALPAQEGSRWRVVIRFTRVTTQPLDPDNHGGSVKATLDCLREAFPENIRDDSPEDIDLLLRQIRCQTKDEEGTWVEVLEESED